MNLNRNLHQTRGTWFSPSSGKRENAGGTPGPNPLRTGPASEVLLAVQTKDTASERITEIDQIPAIRISYVKSTIKRPEIRDGLTMSCQAYMVGSPPVNKTLILLT